MFYVHAHTSCVSYRHDDTCQQHVTFLYDLLFGPVPTYEPSGMRAPQCCPCSPAPPSHPDAMWPPPCPGCHVTQVWGWRGLVTCLPWHTLGRRQRGPVGDVPHLLLLACCSDTRRHGAKSSPLPSPTPTPPTSHPPCPPLYRSLSLSLPLPHN